MLLVNDMTEIWNQDCSLEYRVIPRISQKHRDIISRSLAGAEMGEILESLSNHPPPVCWS